MINKKILALTLAATFVAGTAQAVVIDDFDIGAQSVTAPGSDTIATASAIGGFRTISITKSGPLGATAAVIPNPPAGIYSHSADSLTSATSIITWDANGAGLGGVDLVEGLINNVFSFDILGIDQGAIDLVLGVEDTLGATDAFTFSGAGLGTQTVAFSNFSGIDFTSVDLLSLKVVGGVASDLTLDLLSTSGDQVPPPSVPEPASLALLGLGLTGLAFGRRKAK